MDAHESPSHNNFYIYTNFQTIFHKSHKSNNIRLFSYDSLNITSTLHLYSQLFHRQTQPRAFEKMRIPCLETNSFYVPFSKIKT